MARLMCWHRKWERLPSRMALGIIIVIAVASLAQILPMLFVKSSVPIIASVQPYTPLELAGRDVHVAKGC